ncbi:MAG TPA: ATP-binding protein [Roseiflexaceae bacterium]|nr:ATP-binding protein [Roseiflexaceae bacterium]
MTALLRWTMRIGPIAALLNMLGYFPDPSWTTPIGSAGVIVLVLIAWWCLRLARHDQIRRAAEIYIITGMSIMSLVVFIAARNEALLGAMGMSVFVVIATFFEPPRSALRWGALGSLLYEAGFLARNLDPSRDLGMHIDIVSLYIVPPVILLYLALAGRIINEHLTRALNASESVGHELARSYAEVELRIAERTHDLLKERYRLNHALRELTAARDQAEAASRAKSTFLANMSHELRTPLTTILGYAGLLEQHEQIAADPRLLSDLTRISGAGNHLLELISDVLDLAQIEAGDMEVYTQQFDFAALIDECVEAVRPAVAKNSNRLHIDLGQAPTEICLDRAKIRQILINLLSNAAKFTEDGDIYLRVGLEAGAARCDTLPASNPQPQTSSLIIFEVADTGIGIQPEQLPTLFQPFAKGRVGEARVYDGTGLGLALCRRFCELMGGDLAVASEPGQGSTFTVRLPFATGSAAQAATAAAITDCS